MYKILHIPTALPVYGYHLDCMYEPDKSDQYIIKGDDLYKACLILFKTYESAKGYISNNNYISIHNNYVILTDDVYGDPYYLGQDLNHHHLEVVYAPETDSV